MTKRKPKQVYGTVTGEPGDQILIGAETGVFKPRENHHVSGGNVTTLDYVPVSDALDRVLDEAACDAERILHTYLGDDWKSELKKLDQDFLATGIVSEYLAPLPPGKRPLPEAKIKVVCSFGQRYRCVVVKSNPNPLNHTLREILSQQQIAQLIDACELRFKISFVRNNPLDYPTEVRMRDCVRLGLLWQQMKLRAIEADAVRGKVTVQAAGAGGKAVAKLTDEQKRIVRNAAAEAKLLGKKLTAVDARFANEFKVSAKTIERARKEKPSDNPANV